jgi:hypothetical protein
MVATTRSKVVELSSHAPTQVLTFGLIAIASSVLLYVFVAAPMLDTFFRSFLRSEVVRDGSHVAFSISENRPDEIVETGLLTNWALVDPRSMSANKQPVLSVDPDAPPRPLHRAEYIFKPVIALAPLAMIGGLLIAIILTSILPGVGGYLAQKIEREILVALDRIAFAQYGEHTRDEISSLTRELTRADARALHDLASLFGVPFADLELLQRALQWRDASGISRLTKTHDAIKFYMREYFTDRYSNAVLGLVYMGAAVLIIVIGMRGLKFLPATDPSVVLSALGLEFILLVTYAAILMYGRNEDQTTSLASLSASHSGEVVDAGTDTENLLRAFLAIPRSGTVDGRS